MKSTIFNLLQSFGHRFAVCALIMGLSTAVYAQSEDSDDDDGQEQGIRQPDRSRLMQDNYPTVTLHGKVVDQATGNAVTGIQLRALGNNRYTAMTGEDGTFTIKVPTFTTALYVYSPEFLPQQVGIIAGDSTQTIVVKMLSDKFAPMYGTGTEYTARRTAIIDRFGVTVDNEVASELGGDVRSIMRSAAQDGGANMFIRGLNSITSDAQKQIEEDIEILARIAKKICLPYTLLVRTDWDKFPGAYYTVGIDTSMPNGRTLQMGSIHHYKTNFSEPYGITYEDKDGEHKFVHQTTYGMSERLVGALIGVHGDDQGLIMPPGIAPFQIVLIPIFKKDNQEAVMAAAKEMETVLKNAGFRVKFDDRDDRPGAKYYEWEMKGVPLRLELGGRDIENKVVSFFRRDTAEKGTIAIENLIPGVQMLLDDISDTMFNRANEIQKQRTVDIDSMDNIPEDKILRFGWCGCDECGHKFEDTTGFKILGRPYHKEEFKGKCIVCGKETDTPAYAAHTM